MNTRNDREAPTRPLELLGIGETEELVYGALLKRNKASVIQVAGDLRITRQKAGRLLEKIEALGLATHTPAVPRVYVAVEPELAIDALIKQRQRALEDARAAIPVLVETFVQSPDDQDKQPMLELISNREYLNSVLLRIYKSFRSDIMSFQRAPILLPGARSTGAVPPGALVRTISDNSFLETSAGLESISEDLKQGEQARTFPNLPFKMMIIDRSFAILTLDSRKPETAPTLLVHRGALLDALCLLFEFVWEKATPILAVHEGKLKPGQGGAQFTDSAMALLPLMAAGLNDKSIAQEMQLSASTLNRRIAELMEASGTRTRFQLGVHFASKNGLTRPSHKNK